MNSIRAERCAREPTRECVLQTGLPPPRTIGAAGPGRALLFPVERHSEPVKAQNGSQHWHFVCFICSIAAPRYMYSGICRVYWWAILVGCYQLSVTINLSRRRMVRGFFHLLHCNSKIQRHLPCILVNHLGWTFPLETVNL